MNLVRLTLIATLGAVAAYALSIYAALPKEAIVMAPTRIAEVQAMCPSIANYGSGLGMVLVAVVAIGGALAVAYVDFNRRVY